MTLQDSLRHKKAQEAQMIGSEPIIRALCAFLWLVTTSWRPSQLELQALHEPADPT